MPFDRLIDGWFPLTYALNNMTRGLGLADAYPFVLSPTAVEKLRYIHDLVCEHDLVRERNMPVAALPVSSGAMADRS